MKSPRVGRRLKVGLGLMLLLLLVGGGRMAWRSRTPEKGNVPVLTSSGGTQFRFYAATYGKTHQLIPGRGWRDNLARILPKKYRGQETRVHQVDRQTDGLVLWTVPSGMPGPGPQIRLVILDGELELPCQFWETDGPFLAFKPAVFPWRDPLLHFRLEEQLPGGTWKVRVELGNSSGVMPETTWKVKGIPAQWSPRWQKASTNLLGAKKSPSMASVASLLENPISP